MGILEKISIVIAGLAIIAFFVIMFILAIKQEKAEKTRRGGKSLKEFLAEEEAEKIAMLEDDSEIQYTEVNATIQDMRCGVEVYGMKLPKTVIYEFLGLYALRLRFAEGLFRLLPAGTGGRGSESRVSAACDGGP